MRLPKICCRRTLLLLATTLSLSASAQITLVRKGRPAARIVLADTTATNRRAATVLNHFVNKLTGATLPVAQGAAKGGKNAIIIGETTPDAGEDGFRIVCHEGTLRVMSGGDKGAVLGVCRLLERHFGINYLAKGAWTAHHVQQHQLKTVPTLELPAIDWAETPAFRYRQSQSYGEQDPLFVDWFGWEQPRQMFMDNMWVHTFNRILPSDVYGAEHPEWYALINGKRQPGHHSQWCLTNESLFEQVCHNLDSIFARNPSMKMISVSQNDGNNTNCHCAECLKVEQEEGSASGPIIRFMNRLATRYPDKEFSTLAYLYSMQPPRRVRPLPNVNIMLCSIDAKRELPLTDNASGRDFVRALEGWSIISNNIFVWDYGINFDNMVSPFPNFHVLAPNIQLFKRNHANMLFEQVNGQTGTDFAELRAWMIGKLMWNPYQDADSLMQVFLNDYYGAAAPFLYSYRKLMEGALLSSGTPLWIYDSPITHKDGMLNDALMAAYQTLFDKAEEAVASDSTLLHRVRLSRLPLQYAELEIARTRPGGDEEETERKVRLFRERCVGYGVQSLNERNNSPADYCDLYLQRYLPSRIRNKAKGTATVSYAKAPHPRYAGIATAALTDGLFGGAGYVEGWIGWEADDPDFTIDLQKPTSLSSISTDFLHQLGAWVLLPKEVNYEISADGEHFTPFGSTVSLAEDRDLSIKFVEAKASVPQPVMARYIRVRVKATGMCPSWHYGVGYPAWCFIDEVMVE